LRSVPQKGKNYLTYPPKIFDFQRPLSQKLIERSKFFHLFKQHPNIGSSAKLLKILTRRFHKIWGKKNFEGVAPSYGEGNPFILKLFHKASTIVLNS